MSREGANLIAGVFSTVRLFHGEGAVWAEAWGGLRCVDMFVGDVLSFTPDGGASRHNVGSLAAMIRPCADGRAIVARRHDVVFWDEQGIHPLTTAFLSGRERLNDGSCTPSGQLLVGSTTPGIPGAGRLFEVDASGAWAVVLGSVTTSNGIGFSPDGARAYYADSATGCLDAFDVADDGTLVGRRVLSTFDPGENPDGLWVDVDGGVWVALYGGARVQRVLPNGSHDLSVTVPARHVTSCTFGGHDGSTIFITTSREGLRPEEEPAAGLVFAAHVGIAGLPVLSFGG